MYAPVLEALGTAGTLMGVVRYLKDHRPGVQVWAIEPPVGEMVDGLKNFDEGFVPPVFTDNDGAKLLDRKKIVGPKESIEGVRKLMEVGVFAGISAGAVLVGALKCAADIAEGTNVMVVADGGCKYLCTGPWTQDIDKAAERARSIIYF